jgi:hypothetical protein
MNRPSIGIDVRDAEGNHIGHIPAWRNFIEHGMPEFGRIEAELMEYNARRLYTNVSFGGAPDLHTELVFDSEEDMVMFMLRWG